jgi:hypothetical protein
MSEELWVFVNQMKQPLTGAVLCYIIHKFAGMQTIVFYKNVAATE